MRRICGKSFQKSREMFIKIELLTSNKENQNVIHSQNSKQWKMWIKIQIKVKTSIKNKIVMHNIAVKSLKNPQKSGYKTK